ncbi:MAG TPA: IclR family transcriptional regulator [Herbaspirillum sp.]|jgi:DNA-binding IclR family transcriptional regulator
MNEGSANDGVLARAAAIFKVLAENSEAVSVSSVATALDLSTSTVHRLLNELVRIGWVERAPMRRYRASFEFYRLSAVVARNVPGVTVCRPFLLDIVRQVDETCFFAMAMRDQLSMMIAERVDPTQPLQYRFQMHQTRSLIWGAPARAILSALSDAEIGLAVANAPLSLKGKRPPPLAQIMQEMVEIRGRGYCITRGEILEWAVSIASPVFGADQKVVGAIALIVPEMRFRGSSESTYAKLITSQARRLSGAMGASQRFCDLSLRP